MEGKGTIGLHLRARGRNDEEKQETQGNTTLCYVLMEINMK